MASIAIILMALATRMGYNDSELYCDEKTARQLDERERQDYAATLLMSASRHHAPGLGTLATGITQTHRQLRDRISSIMGRRKPLVWLSAAFFLLALLSLLGAFATSEAILKPRLGRLAPFPLAPAQGIQSEQQAFDWARQLMERSEFAIDPQENWFWERYAQDQYPGVYRIAARGEQDAAYAEASFDPQGQLISLSNFRSPGAEVIYGNALSERSDPHGMGEDLKRFIALARPGMEGEIEYSLCEEAQIGAETFWIFTFFDGSPAQDGMVRPLARITVEARLQPRIVRVDFDPEPLSSNG